MRSPRGGLLALLLQSRSLQAAATATSTDPSALLDVPAGLNTLYTATNGGTLKCTHQIDTSPSGYIENGSGKDGTHYCGDASTPTYIYWTSNMDVDCDGGSTSGDACSNDPSHDSETTYQDLSNKNINAVSVPYVVIDDDKYFAPEKLGIQPLSAVAVVCGGKLTFGVWADTNGAAEMGEASLKLAQTCFGSGMTGDNGHDAADVLYIAFIGSKSETVPSGSGSDFGTLASIGSALVSKAFGGSAANATSSQASNMTGTTLASASSAELPTSSSEPADTPSSTPPATTPASTTTSLSTAEAVPPASTVAAAPSASSTSAPSSPSSGTWGTEEILLAVLGVLALTAIGGVLFALLHRHPNSIASRRRGEGESDTDQLLSSSPSSDDSESDVEKGPRRGGRRRRGREDSSSDSSSRSD